MDEKELPQPPSEPQLKTEFGAEVEVPWGGGIPPRRDVKGLVKKLCLVMGELKNLPKNGYNKFHDYHYVKESDVVNGIRDLLAKNNVFVFHDQKEVTNKEVKGRDGKTSFVTFVRLEYTFIDGDSGQERKVTIHGYGHDSMEKGLYKALAGAHKYFLMKNFNLSEGTEDDPENEGGEKPPQQNRNQNQRPPQNQGQRKPPPQRQGGNPPAQKTDQQKAVSWFIIEADKCGYDEQAQRELIANFFPDVKSRSQLTREQVKELVETMKANPF